MDNTVQNIDAFECALIDLDFECFWHLVSEACMEKYPDMPNSVEDVGYHILEELFPKLSDSAIYSYIAEGQKLTWTSRISTHDLSTCGERTWFSIVDLVVERPSLVMAVCKKVTSGPLARHSKLQQQMSAYLFRDFDVILTLARPEDMPFVMVSMTTALENRMYVGPKFEKTLKRLDVIFGDIPLVALYKN